jgi:predicted kinase
MAPTLYLLSGMAGAGKTTRARQIEAETGAVRFSPDEWLLELMSDPDDRSEMDRMRPLVEDLQWQVAGNLLTKGLDVVLENGFWRRTERLERCRAGQQLGARVVLYFLDPPGDVLFERIRLRNLNPPAKSLYITERELDLWLGSRLERPEDDELDAYDHHVIFKE